MFTLAPPKDVGLFSLGFNNIQGALLIASYQADLYIFYFFPPQIISEYLRGCTEAKILK